MCTDFILPFGEPRQPIISGRTMDYSQSPTNTYVTDLIKVPKGLTFTAIAPKLRSGHSWVNQYGFIGVCMMPDKGKRNHGNAEVDPTMLVYSDGLNTEGLSAAVLWLSYSDYEKPGDDSQCLDIEAIIGYILGTCATVDDVQTNLAELTVWWPGKWEVIAPFHIAVHDSSGESLVLEFIGGKKIYYNNTIGVLANGPTFDVHATHFYYSCNALTATDNTTDKYIQVIKDKSGRCNITWGNGYQYEVLSSGMFGLPGDSSSPSRFNRAAKLRECVPPIYDGREGVQYALQVLDRLEVCEQEILTYYNPSGEPEDPRNTYNPTLWKVVRNHRDKILYYCTRLNHNLRSVELDKLDFSKGSHTGVLPMADDQWVIDRTPELRSSPVDR